MLADAIACYYKHKVCQEPQGTRLLFEEVRLGWMHSRSRNGVFAFRNLCESLGIDPDALVNALEKRTGPRRTGVTRDSRLAAANGGAGMTASGAGAFRQRTTSARAQARPVSLS